ncbi:MAG TPA: hypothetical protein VIT65_23270 [Microlunatus sp.]
MGLPDCIGIDFGVRRIALGSADPPFSNHIDLGKKPLDRQVEIHQLTRFLRGQGLGHATTVWVEHPFMGRGNSNIATAISLGETVGIIRGARLWLTVNIVHQSTWKAGLLGNGGANKDEIAIWLATHHPQLFSICLDNQDRMDAMCIGLYGKLRLEGVIDPPTPRLKSRKKRA